MVTGTFQDYDLRICMTLQSSRQLIKKCLIEGVQSLGSIEGGFDHLRSWVKNENRSKGHGVDYNF
jgi:hypothetical protein